ncbi:thiosulfate dehydrogenase [quinone] large subunit [Chitinophaga rupis]|uniref:Thiosulfate dehydrogenase [quinone] large subunit n=1 Tax=Chitinophaga rupis TaxID=573321 RepID=A0A1H7YA10_9BACT|nr:DoxX family membrane protein [Chitinophaga rupis]SEM42785.1 thiosulfate dehydrogenase [quinone] large subunit [Chitinophaga rupis]
MNTVSFLLLRLAIGASFFGHGLVRLPKLAAFSGWMTGTFKKSMLPEMLVIPFSYALPVAEFIIGLLLLSGLFTKAAAVAGSIVMLILIFGTCMIENWEALPSQFIHIAFLAALLQFIQHNSWALDEMMRGK